MKINNIYCVGRNFKKHAQELGNDVPSKPMMFSKPTHSFVTANGQSVMMPKNRGAVHYEVELVYRLGRQYEKGMTANDCLTEMAVGIDFTLREEQEKLKKKGHPWLIAKGFPNAALVTPFFAFPGIENILQSTFSLQINGTRVQQGDPNDMIFQLDNLLAYCYEYIGLGAGDLLFTGTPEGVGEINYGDEVTMWYNEELKGTAMIK
ncbi:fumarylacetoacetate hydrolase [Salipaludibacillus keqinensis]|uniref:Fumarylacetoacetate hydrolase n=1 Tax=Salipaludibacillus keqinensis TaxID=2045207 RepID=A0A323TGH2_9BACI|nr:fumarylacetoacetate hydrolase family protein [Salipaludibacillus keqinensis]PYZ93869.1 fumarylacetoacetate hydrolase [Salipaludibacillus keqinensis]